jgi:hypothetical protein
MVNDLLFCPRHLVLGIGIRPQPSNWREATGLLEEDGGGGQWKSTCRQADEVLVVGASRQQPGPDWL